MQIDTKDLVKKSEKFAINIAQQISKISVKAFCEISFHSSEFRNKEVLANNLHKIRKSSSPLIYVFKVKSREKLSILTEYFEDYHAANKQKVKNKDRVNLSRYNKTITDVLYVGSSTTDFKTRIKNHLGTEGTRVYSLHLCKWDRDLEYFLDISVYEIVSESDEIVERFIVEILEQQLWDKLSPLFGKRSGL